MALPFCFIPGYTRITPYVPKMTSKLTSSYLSSNFHELAQRNLSRPPFSRPVSSPRFPLSNECNVLAREQRFLVVRSSSILPSQWFFVSRDELKGGSLRRQRTPGQARLGRMDDDLTARNLWSPASTLHSLECGNWGLDTGPLKGGRDEFRWN